jgi:hypothetical protein
MSNNNSKTNDNPIYTSIFKTPKNSFQNHLDLIGNERIMFSGAYGLGKTTFLNYFFEEEENQKKYNVFHLYPVNYTVLENSDIFTYLKYDIFYEMLVNQLIVFPQDDSNGIEDRVKFAYKNMGAVAKFVALSIPELGKTFKSMFEEWEKLMVKWEDYKERTVGEELHAMQKFFEVIHAEEGGLYEKNFLTEIIIDTLSRQKEQTKRENILIIDDLDRIDPHHIFRILNVFAAHFDQRNTGEELTNKFGFDKVVVVCDIKNIRSIFRHYYGVEAQFNGYIDKFYSKSPYYFDNKQNIAPIVETAIDKLTINFVNREIKDVNYHNIIKKSIEAILTDIALAGHLNLRALFKFKEVNLVINDLTIQGNSYPGMEFHYIVIIKLLQKYFDDVDYLKDVLAKVFELSTEYKKEYLLPLADIMNNNLHERAHAMETKKHGNFTYSLELYRSNRAQNCYYATDENSSSRTNVNRIPFYPFLIKSIENLQTLNYL